MRPSRCRICVDMRRKERDRIRRQREMPTSGRRNSRNSVNACHTSWRFKYSKLTSRLIELLAGVRRRRSSRSVSVRYRPLIKKTRKEASDATSCAELSRSVILASVLTRGSAGLV